MARGALLALLCVAAFAGASAYTCNDKMKVRLEPNRRRRHPLNSEQRGAAGSHRGSQPALGHGCTLR